MNVTNSGLNSLFDRWANVASTKVSAASRKDAAEDAQEMFQAAKENVGNETMRTWDKHIDMVEKAQELRQVHDRKEAIERQSQERREDQTELMARVAIENANRTSLIESQSLIRQAEEMAAVA